MARLTAQLATPAGLREAWCLRLLADDATYLVSGVGVEPDAHGPAYSVAAPGQVRAWRPEQTRRSGNRYWQASLPAG